MASIRLLHTLSVKKALQNDFEELGTEKVVSSPKGDAASMNAAYDSLEMHESHVADLVNSIHPKDESSLKSRTAKHLFSHAREKLLTQVETLSKAIFEVTGQHKQILADIAEKKRHPPMLPILDSYSLISLREKYRINDPQKGVIYMTPAQRSSFEVVARDGQLFLGDGINPIDSIHFSASGILDYVMDETGAFYACRPAGIVHHSSIVGGEPVAGAGELITRNGKVIQLNNRSGHYRPGFAHLLQTWIRLNHLDVVADDAEIQFFPDHIFRNSDLVKHFELFGPAPFEEERIRATLAALNYLKIKLSVYSRNKT